MLKLDGNYGFYELFLKDVFIFRFYVAFTLNMSNNRYPQNIDSPPRSLFYSVEVIILLLSIKRFPK